MIDDGAFDGLDSHGRFIDAKNTGRFTGGRTNTTSEFREIIGGVELANGIAPTALPNEIVPIGNDIRKRTTGVAEGNAAIHTTAALQAHLFLVEGLIHLEVVIDSFGNRTAGGRFSRVF